VADLPLPQEADARFLDFGRGFRQNICSLVALLGDNSAMDDIRFFSSAGPQAWRAYHCQAVLKIIIWVLGTVTVASLCLSLVTLNETVCHEMRTLGLQYDSSELE
jgi:hypothetical protein